MKKFLYMIAITIFAKSAFVYAQEDLLEPETTPAEVVPTMEIPVNTPPVPIIAPVAIPEDTDPAIKAMDNAALPQPGTAAVDKDNKKYRPFDGINSDTLNSGLRSFFYSQEQLDILYDRIKKFKTNADPQGSIISDIKDTAIKQLSKTTVETPRIEAVTTPTERVFFLSSIIYLGDDDWTVWVNENKIRKSQAKLIPDYTIKSIGENFIEILFRAKNLEIDSPGYKYILKPQDNLQTKVNITDNEISYKVLNDKDSLSMNSLVANLNWDYKSEDGKIWVASADNIVKITLKLWQSFRLSKMAIIEGRDTAPAVAAQQPTESIDPQAKKYPLIETPPIPKRLKKDEEIISAEPNDLDELKPVNAGKDMSVKKAKQQKAPDTSVIQKFAVPPKN